MQLAEPGKSVHGREPERRVLFQNARHADGAAIANKVLQILCLHAPRRAIDEAGHQHLRDVITDRVREH